VTTFRCAIGILVMALVLSGASPGYPAYERANRLLVDSRTAAILESLAWGVGATIVIVAGMSEKTPAALPAFGWALLAGAAGAAFLRSRAWAAALVVAVLVPMIILDTISPTAAVALIVVFALLQSRWGALVAALAAIGGAAWWSAGGSREAATLLWHKYSPFADASAPAATASAVEQASRLEGVLWPALFIGVLLVLAAVLRGITRRRGGPDGEEFGEIS